MTYPPKVIARVTLYAVRMDNYSNLELRERVLWEMGTYFTVPGGWKVLVAKDFAGAPIYPWRRSPEEAVGAFVERHEICRKTYLIRADQEADDIRAARELLETEIEPGT